ncbi:sensor histidine kinase [Nonomuraea sp. NPDC059023]|uniref:sensor histidine kinase n=1 Tax=unclassified Nonomuraea TaxID=2593643 RepID=UPI0036D02423
MKSTPMAGLRRRPAIRMRMALSYWGLFVASGAVLLILTVGLWQGETTTTVHVPGTQAVTTHSSDLGKLLTLAGVALAVMAVVSLLFGWLVAGRFLAPIRAITTAARRISATNLHERLSLQGPDDDLKELADTIDELLARLERSFESERRFAASASHELRTPMTTMRVWLDVAMAKPGPLPPQLVSLGDRIRNELDHVDALLESLLILARTQQGPSDDRSRVALSAITAAALQRHAGTIAALPLHVDHRPCPQAWVTGSETLLTRMIGNVVDNAVRHNRQGGWIRVSAETGHKQARLVVENTGTVLTPEDLGRLTEPFRRPDAERTGTGLGLSIVKAITEAHNGTLSLYARPEGGLRLVITLPEDHA